MKNIKHLLKVLFIVIILFDLEVVLANEMREITNDIEIQYKWYKKKQLKTGDYYSLKLIKEEDIIDETNIKLGNKSEYKEEFCKLSEKYYVIDKEDINEYKKVSDVAYVKIENIEYNNNIDIYYDNQKLNFRILSNENNTVKLNLEGTRQIDKLMFLINTNNSYKITLYIDLLFKQEIISKTIDNSKIVIPDKTWINKNTKYYTLTTKEKIHENDFISLIKQSSKCSYQEKYVFKYDVVKEYYDDNYYSYIEGYQKDITNFKIFYIGDEIVNTIEIEKEKIIKEPKIEYVYIKENTDIQNKDSSKELQCTPTTITKVENKIVEKQIFKIPPKIYFLIFTLSTIVLFLLFKLVKKYVG